MMRYYKIIYDGYILAVGIGDGYIEITKNEYDVILNEISNMPIAQEGHCYRLKKDLTWELCKITEEEYSQAVEEQGGD